LNSRTLRNGIVTMVLVVGTAALLYMFLFQSPAVTKIPYNGDGSFLQLVKQGKVSNVVQREARLDVTLTEIGPSGKAEVRVSQVPSFFVTDVQQDMNNVVCGNPATGGGR